MSSVDVEESSTVHGSLLYRLKHTWTIKHFVATYLVDSTDMEEYPKLFSEWFNSSRDSTVEFRVIVRPRGRHEESRNHLGLYLEMKGSGPSPLAKSADIKYSFSLLNERKEKCNTLGIINNNSHSIND